jgi:ABC-type Fe3+ transport system permease subunit
MDVWSLVLVAGVIGIWLALGGAVAYLASRTDASRVRG